MTELSLYTWEFISRGVALVTVGPAFGGSYTEKRVKNISTIIPQEDTCICRHLDRHHTSEPNGSALLRWVDYETAEL